MRTRPRSLGSASGLTFIEMMMAFTIMLIIAAILLPVLARGREAARRTVCLNNMRQMGIAFMMISGENDGFYPPGLPNHMYGDHVEGDPARQLIRNNYMVDVRDMYTEYIDDMKSFVCQSSPWGERLGIRDPEEWYCDMTFAPGYMPEGFLERGRNAELLREHVGPREDEECMTNQQYTYLPYAVLTEEHGIFLFLALDYLMSTGAIDIMQRELTVDGPHAPGLSNTFHRLRIGVEKFFITDVSRPEASVVASTQIPVMYESTSFNGAVALSHVVPLGGNVLYMDGHVEFQRYRPVNRLLPYTKNFMLWTSRNVFTNQPLSNVPPWCSNRTPGTPFEPRYRYYPRDPAYSGLVF